MRLGRRFGVFFAVIAVSAPWSEALGQLCQSPCVGPAHGAVLAAGGGDLGEEIYGRFVELAGGEDARIVIIPTAGAEEGSHDAWTAIEALKAVGVRRFEILHTRSRAVADLEAFAAPLRDATGVWISGGRQWRLIDVYLGTRTHDALTLLLRQGGVIGGNSAGASVLASFLIRGAVENNRTVVAPGREEGFGFLRGVAIDQHVLARGREGDLMEVLNSRPDLLGIGLNEGSAIVVTGDLAEVVGRSMVAVYDVTDPLHLIPLRWLRPGEVYDLGARRVHMDGGPGSRSPPGP